MRTFNDSARTSVFEAERPRGEGIPPSAVAAIIRWHLQPLSKTMHAWTGFAFLLTIYTMALDCWDAILGMGLGVLWTCLCIVWVYRFLTRLICEVLVDRQVFQRPRWKAFVFMPLAITGLWLAQVIFLLPGVGFAFRGQ